MFSKISGLLVLVSLAVISFLSMAATSPKVVFEKHVEISNPIDASGGLYVNLEDKALGRAWIRVSYSDGDHTEDTGYATRAIDVAVPNLHYDPKRKEIYFTTKANQKIVCGTNVKKKLLDNQSFKDTERCEVKVELTKAAVDDGFKVRKPMGALVTMTIKQ